MGKTITTYLIDGKPQGSKYITISNRICKMLSIPRANLDVINKRDDLKFPTLYILLGSTENQEKLAYIGETENFRERIKDHESNKPFWQKVLVFISQDYSLTKADVQYLENLAIHLALKAKNYLLSENKQSPKTPNMPEHQKNNIEEFFEDVKFLTSFSGVDIFEIPDKKDQHLFYVKSRGCDATGFYNEMGFTLLKGSIIAKDTTNSFSWKEKRAKEIDEFTSLENGNLVLNVDRTFNSPSAASDFCLGSSSNGWTIWKDENGKTLNEVFRSKLNN